MIWYSYNGDEICWNGAQYISLLCEGGFNTLEEMDRFWEDYGKAMKAMTGHNGDPKTCSRCLVSVRPACINCGHSLSGNVDSSKNETACEYCDTTQQIGNKGD